MDDWNAPHPAATTVNGPAPHRPRTLTRPLAQARSFMDDFHPCSSSTSTPPRHWPPERPSGGPGRRTFTLAAARLTHPTRRPRHSYATASMDRSSPPAAAALHGCRSGAAVRLTPPGAWSSSPAQALSPERVTPASGSVPSVWGYLCAERRGTSVWLALSSSRDANKRHENAPDRDGRLRRYSA
jgi:hypothetical protein